MKKEFDAIIGYSNEKAELERISDILRNPEKYRKLGVKMPRGLLLYGDPGLGKTLMAKTLIDASRLPAVICRKARADGDFVDHINETFESAKRLAPSIILLDDLDKFSNADYRRRNADEYVTVQSLIDELGETPVFVLATANDIDILPDSLIRSGRFDSLMHILPPHGAEAQEIITHYLENKQIADDLDTGYLVRLMDGRSCAELETVINDAGILAAHENAEKIEMDHIVRACLRTILGSDNTIDEEEEEYSAFASDSAETVCTHEAGHAVMSELLRPGSVTLIYACGNGGSRRGFTMYADAPPTIETMQVRMITSLGGRAAVDVRFGKIDSGSTKDVETAFALSHHLISVNCITGISNFDDNPRHGRNARNDAICTAEVEKAYARAKELLTVNRNFLIRVADELRRKTVLTAPELAAIRSHCKIVSVPA